MTEKAKKIEWTEVTVQYGGGTPVYYSLQQVEYELELSRITLNKYLKLLGIVPVTWRLGNRRLSITQEEMQRVKELKANPSLLGQLRAPRPRIVCLCGSTRFSEAFHEATLKETLAGKIVLSIGCDFKSDADLLLAGTLTKEDKKRMDDLHKWKIFLADEVLFLNVGGYMGESTREEERVAKGLHKRLRYLEPVE